MRIVPVTGRTLKIEYVVDAAQGKAAAELAHTLATTMVCPGQCGERCHDGFGTYAEQPLVPGLCRSVPPAVGKPACRQGRGRRERRADQRGDHDGEHALRHRDHGARAVPVRKPAHGGRRRTPSTVPDVRSAAVRSRSPSQPLRSASKCTLTTRPSSTVLRQTLPADVLGLGGRLARGRFRQSHRQTCAPVARGRQSRL